MTAETAGHVRAGALWVLRRTGTSYEARADIVQETVCRALRYDDMRDPFAVGKTIARRLLVDHWRREQNRRPFDAPDAWSELWPQEIVVQIHQQMARLPDHHRPGVEDLLNGESHPSSAAYKRRHRALAALREAA